MAPTKEELPRNITPEENNTLKSITGNLARIATYSSPLYAIHAIVSPQRRREDPETPLTTIQFSHAELQTPNLHIHAECRFISLHESATHVRLYADSAFQNLRTKHLQIVFIIYLTDLHDILNIIQLHSSHAPRQPHLTQKT